MNTLPHLLYTYILALRLSSIFVACLFSKYAQLIKNREVNSHIPWNMAVSSKFKW